MKPAFADLDDIDFGLDSDRHDKKDKAKKDTKKGQDSKKQADSDHGLFVDNDFGDEYEYDDEDFE